MLQGTTNLEVSKWDNKQKRRIKIKLEVIINSDNLILYSYNGAILRKREQQRDQQTNPHIFQNMEQIICLDWQGDYGEKNLKSGRWRAIWKGKQLKGDDGYRKQLKNHYTMKTE